MGENGGPDADRLLDLLLHGQVSPSPDGCVADPCCADASIKFKGDAGNDGLGEWWMQFSGEAGAVAHYGAVIPSLTDVNHDLNKAIFTQYLQAQDFDLRHGASCTRRPRSSRAIPAR